MCTGRNQSPDFKYERQHHVECVTKMLINHLLEDKMTIKIYGNQDLKKKRMKAVKKEETPVAKTQQQPMQ